MPYKYKLSEMSKTGTAKQAEEEFDSPYETFKVGQVKISDDGQRKSEIVDIDSETGQVSWKITQLPGFDKLYDELTDLVSTAKRTYVKTKDDVKFRDFYDEIRVIRNKVRTHLRNEYPDQYKRIVMEEEIDEISTTGGGAGSASFRPGTGMQYATPYAFRLKKKKDKDDIDEGTCGYDRDKKGKKLKGPGGLGEALSYAFSEFDFNIADDAYQAEVEEKIKKELKKVQSKPLEIPEKDLQAIIKNAENYFAKEARKEEKANRKPKKIKSTEFAQFAADYYTEEYYPENYKKDYPDKRGDMKPVYSFDDEKQLKSYDGIDVPSTPEEREIRRRSKLRLKYGHAAYFIRSRDLPKDLFYSMPKDEFDKTFGRIVDEPIQDELVDGNIDILFDKPVMETFKVGQKVTYLGNPGEITKVDKDIRDRVYYNVSYDKGTGKTKASNIYNKDGEIKAIKEGDTYEKMAAKGKKAGSLKQGTVRKRLGIKKGEKIPLSLINKELARLKKMDKDDDKKGVQLGDKNQKYYKALQLSKTLKTTTNVNEDSKNPGATLGPGPKATEDGVKDNYYVKAFKYKLVPKNKDGTYVQKDSGLEVKKLF